MSSRRRAWFRRRRARLRRWRGARCHSRGRRWRGVGPHPVGGVPIPWRRNLSGFAAVAAPDGQRSAPRSITFTVGVAQGGAARAHVLRATNRAEVAKPARGWARPVAGVFAVDGVEVEGGWRGADGRSQFPCQAAERVVGVVLKLPSQHRGAAAVIAGGDAAGDGALPALVN